MLLFVVVAVVCCVCCLLLLLLLMFVVVAVVVVAVCCASCYWTCNALSALEGQKTSLLSNWNCQSAHANDKVPQSVQRRYTILELHARNDDDKLSTIIPECRAGHWIKPGSCKCWVGNLVKQVKQLCFVCVLPLVLMNWVFGDTMIWPLSVNLNCAGPVTVSRGVWL